MDAEHFALLRSFSHLVIFFNFFYPLLIHLTEETNLLFPLFQDVSKFPVGVVITAGIGATPFAALLNQMR